MSGPLRPPPGTGAATFFDEWLPAAFAGREGLPSAPSVRVTLSGAEGGDWRLRAGSDGLEVTRVDARAGRAPDPDVWLRQSAADFLATFGGDPDLPVLLPPRWSALDLLFIDERDVELMRQIEGRILVEIARPAATALGMDLGFGKTGVSAGRPRATVRLDAATFEGLRDGTMAPLQALMQQKIEVVDDKALAMKALMVVAARLAR